MDVNEALLQLGSFGLYQFYVYFLSLLPQYFSGFIFLSSVFISATPDYRCLIDECQTTTDKSQPFDSFSWNSCKKIRINFNESNNSVKNCSEYSHFIETTESCNSFIYSKHQFESTIVTEWDIVCGNSWKLPFSQSVFMLGILFGVLVNGFLADRFGRKTLFAFLPVITLSSCVVTVFAPNYEVYVLSTAITAFSMVGMSQTAFIIGIELIGAKYRVFCANLTNVMFAGGALTLCLMAYHIRDWRRLQFYISFPYILTLFYYWIFPESVRWQASKGQIKSALNAIRRAAKWNGIILNEELFIKKVESKSDINKYYLNFLKNESIKTKPSECQKYGTRDLFRHPITRNWTLNLAFIWITNSIIYFGLAFQASSLGSDLFLTFALLFAADIPMILMASIANQILGRKRILIFCFTIAFISCISTVFISNTNILFTVMAILGKSSISASFAVVYVYTVELYPTPLRSTGLGICSMVSRIGGIIAPFLIKLSIFGDSFPLVFCSIIALISGILALNLPETLGKELPENFDDIERLKFGAILKSRMHSKSFNENNETNERTRLLSQT